MVLINSSLSYTNIKYGIASILSIITFTDDNRRPYCVLWHLLWRALMFYHQQSHPVLACSNCVHSWQKYLFCMNSCWVYLLLFRYYRVGFCEFLFIFIVRLLLHLWFFHFSLEQLSVLKCYSFCIKIIVSIPWFKYVAQNNLKINLYYDMS